MMELKETGNLDAAAGTAGTGTYKHQHNQNGFAGFRPLVEIRGGKAGGGDNRSHLKGRLSQGTEQTTGKMPDIEGDKPHRSQNVIVSIVPLMAERSLHILLMVESTII